MPKNKFYITTAIPYVNAKPHIGFALEAVQADVMARYHRDVLEQDVWFLTGTDDNSLKNVQAAEKEGMPVKDLVDRNAKAFEDLKSILNLSNDDFIRTASEKHFKGAEKLWEACKQDIYKKKYKGLYCVGCEEFKREPDLQNGCCPEHQNEKLEVIEEENYFFALSKYQEKLEKLIESDEYKIFPESRKNEALSFIKSGLEDFSISRSKERAGGWGIPVPGDETQVIYVWFDALTNYITALDYAHDGELYKKYWPADLHVIGKGILKFHAIYWPAMLLSAGVDLPKGLFVHGYATFEGNKISKSLGNVVDPVELVKKYGTDAVRYYLLRETSPFNDLDFSYVRFEIRYAELANDLGNLVQRSLTMINKYEIKPEKIAGTEIYLEEELNKFRFDLALEKIWTEVRNLNVVIDQEKPWELAKNNPEKLAEVLNGIYEELWGVAEALQVFMPETSEKMQKQLKSLKPEPLFPRIET